MRWIAQVCPPRTRELDPFEAAALEGVRPSVPEEELRESVTAEIERAAPAMERAVPVPGIAAALRDVVRQADADLGFRMFLRAAQSYSVPVSKDPHERLPALGDRLAYLFVAVHESLTVR
ncbi:hypothetical protein ACLMNJ_32810 [Streptomyces seoulensis]